MFQETLCGGKYFVVETLFEEIFCAGNVLLRKHCVGKRFVRKYFVEETFCGKSFLSAPLCTLITQNTTTNPMYSKKDPTSYY